MYLTDPLTWMLWSMGLLLTLICLRIPTRQHGNLRWLCPRVYFGIALLFIHVLTALQTMVSGFTFWGFVFPREFNLMLLATIVGGLMFLLGWEWGVLRQPLAPPVPPQRSRPDGHYALRAWVLLPVVPLALFLFRKGAGRGELWLTVFTFFLSALVADSLLFVLAGLDRPRRFQRWGLFALALAVMLLYLAITLRSTSRIRFLLLLLPLGGIWLYRRGQRSATWHVVLAATALMWFFAFWGNVRYHVATGGVRSLSALWHLGGIHGPADVLARFLRAGDLDAFENGMLLMQVIPRWDDYYYGATFASLFVLPIPRAWWPGKPAPMVSRVLVNRFGHQNWNVAVSLAGEAYANLSWPAVVLAFLLLGYVSNRMYTGALARRSDPEVWVHLGLYAAYVVMVMRGSFHSMTSFYLMVIVWLVGSKWLALLLLQPHLEVQVDTSVPPREHPVSEPT